MNTAHHNISLAVDSAWLSLIAAIHMAALYLIHVPGMKLWILSHTQKKHHTIVFDFFFKLLKVDGKETLTKANLMNVAYELNKVMLASVILTAYFFSISCRGPGRYFITVSMMLSSSSSSPQPVGTAFLGRVRLPAAGSSAAAAASASASSRFFRPYWWKTLKCWWDGRK